MLPVMLRILSVDTKRFGISSKKLLILVDVKKKYQQRRRRKGPMKRSKVHPPIVESIAELLHAENAEVQIGA
jgi:hypothetical protein